MANASAITVKYVHFAHHNGPPPNPTANPDGINVYIRGYNCDIMNGIYAMNDTAIVHLQPNVLETFTPIVDLVKIFSRNKMDFFVFGFACRKSHLITITGRNMFDTINDK